MKAKGERMVEMGLGRKAKAELRAIFYVMPRNLDLI